MTHEDSMTEVDPKLLSLLVCPMSKLPLRYDRQAHELVNDGLGIAYPIRDGVPIMLVEEARRFPPADRRHR